MSREATAKRVAIIGGGITGLAAAHRLLEERESGGADLDFVLHESSSRFGGIISTINRDGFLMEDGPDSFITEKPWARDLAARLGIADRLIATREQYRQSFVLSDGKLEPTPLGFHLLAPSRLLPFAMSAIFSPLGKLRIAMELAIPRRRETGDESLGHFVLRRFGREALERMAQPMVAGIYGADPMKLSLLSTFPRFLDMEREHGSVIRGLRVRSRKKAALTEATDAASGARYSLFVSFTGGIEVLVDALLKRLSSERLVTGAHVKSIKQTPEGKWFLKSGDEAQVYDAVIVALPGHATGTLIAGLDAGLASNVSAIVYHASATVNLTYRALDIGHPLDGIGFVVPERERMLLVGCTFSHRKFTSRAPDGHVLLRAYHGDRGAVMDDSELIANTRRELGSLLGISAAPQFSRITRFSRGIPQYFVGHGERLDEIDRLLAGHKGLYLAGNAYRGVGIPDCVNSGENAATAAIAHCASGSTAIR